ncbi:MAG TPA: hypothetical protein PLW81_15810 [Thiobacillaceae bacterium]|nr:hypothetical protein [Thiobacillaceae bacterium]
MYPAYYALRRLNPYRGVTQVIDAGDAMAHSYDGVTWHLRADDGYGWVRPVGVWVSGEGLRVGSPGAAADLLPALETQPQLPFRLIDGLELWLLDKETGLPLALLGAVRPSGQANSNLDPEWHPFAPRHTGFTSPTLASRAGDPRAQPAQHREVLARFVNQAARPFPSAQWFRRTEDGGGVGQRGMRVPQEWLGRMVAKADFPELLVRESWNSRLEKSVIDDYHRYLAPLLLLLPELSEVTRERLEQLACEQPGKLARVRHLLPRILNQERFKAALVAAQLQAASDAGDADFFD